MLGFENSQMMRNRGLCHAQISRQIADTAFTMQKYRQNLNAGVIGKHFKITRDTV